MPSYYLSSLTFVMAFTVLTVSFVSQHLCLDPWASFMRWLTRLRRDRLAKKSAVIEQRMKKYWVIDMRKLR